MPDRPDLTPAQEQEVRRLLADARHTDPLPADVADRLDRVLSGLADEHPARHGVVRLAERRRRAVTLLVAAAAVVVGGVAVGQLVGGLGESSQDAMTAQEGAGDAAPEAADDQDGFLPEEASRAGVVVATIRPRRFTEDVEQLRARGRPTLADGLEGSGPQKQEGRGEPACIPGDWGRGDYRAVRYDGAVGYVVFRRPQGETQVVDLFLCGGDDAVRSVTLPSR